MKQLSFLEHDTHMRCPNHKCFPLDQIDLTGKSPNGRTCLACIQEENISQDQYLSIYELFGHEDGEVFNSYPPFKSQNIRDLIQKYCSQRVQKPNINSFFNKMREDIEVAIQDAENRAKQELIRNESSSQQLRNEINKIAETNKLKQLVASGSSQDLNKFLLEKWNNAEQNEQIIQACIGEIEGGCSFLNITQRQKELNCLIQSLQLLTLFDSPITFIPNYINCVPSQYYEDSKQSLQIERLRDEIVITNMAETDNKGRQCYLEQALDPNKKYVISLELNNIYNEIPYIYFGLITEMDKDVKHMVNSKIFHGEGKNSTINKMTRGWFVHSNKERQIGKKKLEFRIHLIDRVVKISSQNYQCVAELKDKNLIDLSKKYHFAISIQLPGDSVRILSVMKVSSFNLDM